MSTESERLRKLRSVLGLATRPLAEAIGYSQGTISQIENDPTKTIETKMIRALHLAFGVNEEWLKNGVGGDDPVFDPKPEIPPTAMAEFIRNCLNELSDKNREILMSVIRDLAETDPAPSTGEKKA